MTCALMKVPQQLADSRRPAFAEVPSWQRATPDSVKDFSAACYFLAARSAHDRESADRRDRRQLGRNSDPRLDGRGSGPRQRRRQARPTGRPLSLGIRRRPSGNSATSGAHGGVRRRATRRARNRGTRAIDWPGSRFRRLSYWDDWGREWKALIGAIWAREHVTAHSRRRGATRDAVAQCRRRHGPDVRQRQSPSAARTTRRTPQLSDAQGRAAKPGANEILVYARNVWGLGGFKGRQTSCALTFADGHSKPLAKRLAIFEDRRCGRPAADPAVEKDHPASRPSTMRWSRRSGRSGSRASPGTRAKPTSGSPATTSASQPGWQIGARSSATRSCPS